MGRGRNLLQPARLWEDLSPSLEAWTRRALQQHRCLRCYQARPYQVARHCIGVPWRPEERLLQRPSAANVIPSLLTAP